jgi:hypothetical protein
LSGHPPAVMFTVTLALDFGPTVTLDELNVVALVPVK